MKGPTQQLAAYAVALKFDDIPANVLQCAKNTIADGVGAMIFGYDLPWSRMIANYALRYGSGNSHILGRGAPKVATPYAALVNGALAHAFELDGATKPSFGVHPCATIFPALLAMAQERGANGRDVLVAFVAATEVVTRIGRATRKSNEHRGFHGPGTTGAFGAAVAAGRMLGLDADELTNAIGISASLACGIVQFTRGGTGAMVKRLHFGRASESGVLAASLAADGFTGPHDALEGELGFLAAYCDEQDVAALTRELGSNWQTATIYMKRFACHGAAQIALQALQDLQAEHRFGGDAVDRVEVSGSKERVDRHNQLEPRDRMLAQYSVPFSVAVGCYRDPKDPRSFDQSAVEDPAIRALAKRVRFHVSDDPSERTAEGNTVTVVLKDGRQLRRSAKTFLGTPQMPASVADVREKFNILTRHCAPGPMQQVFDRIQALEQQDDVDWIRA